MQKRWLIGINIILLIVIIVASSFLSVGTSYAQPVPTVTPIPTAQVNTEPLTYIVQRGTVQETMTFSGLWLPRDQQTLSFNIAGTIRSIYVQPNSRVTTGTVLADYQIDELENALQQAQTDLKDAQSNQTSNDNSLNITRAQIDLANTNLDLQDTIDSQPWASLNAASLSLKDAQERLKDAQVAYNNTIGDPSNSPSDIDGAYNNLRSAERSVLSAQNSYWAAAQNFNNYQYNIDRAQNRLFSQNLNLQVAIQNGSNNSQAQTIAEAQTLIDQLTAEIKQSTLYAPFDGIVLDVNVFSGTQVQPSQAIMTMALPEPLEVVADLAINDAQRLSVGMVGVCQVMNQPDTAVQCIVRQVPLGNTGQKVRVAASLENVPLGQLITVEMPLGLRENVLWLPSQAIRTFQNRTFVVVQAPDGERVVDITIGLRTNERVEIISGVSEGDVIIGQ